MTTLILPIVCVFFPFLVSRRSSGRSFLASCCCWWIYKTVEPIWIASTIRSWRLAKAGPSSSSFRDQERTHRLFPNRCCLDFSLCWFPSSWGRNMGCSTALIMTVTLANSVSLTILNTSRSKKNKRPIKTDFYFEPDMYRHYPHLFLYPAISLPTNGNRVTLKDETDLRISTD